MGKGETSYCISNGSSDYDRSSSQVILEDGNLLNRFCDALQNEDEENFYHGVLIGILGVKERWGVSLP